MSKGDETLIGVYETALDFDDLFCEDVIVIICSFLGAHDLWNHTRLVNRSFRNETMNNRLWKELYHLRWGETSNCIYHRSFQEETVPWWKLYMERLVFSYLISNSHNLFNDRHKWLSFEFNTNELCLAKQGESYSLFHSVNNMDDETLVFYERLNSLNQIARDCGMTLLSHKPRSHSPNSSNIGSNTVNSSPVNGFFLPNIIPKSSVEECLIFCKLFLSTYYGEYQFPTTERPNKFFASILNLQALFLLVQAYSMAGDFCRLVTYTTECLDHIQYIKDIYPHFTSEERSSYDYGMIEDVIEKCHFYRGYSLYKIGFHIKAEVELQQAETILKDENESSSSRQYYHKMNIQFTLMNNGIKLRLFGKSLQHLNNLISIIVHTIDEQQNKQAPNNLSPTKTDRSVSQKMETNLPLELVDDKIYQLLNGWFPGVPYFPLAEYLHKEQEYTSSKRLFEKYIEYEQGKKQSVHKKMNVNQPCCDNCSFKDKQLIHASNRISQINSLIQSDQEY